LGSIDQAEKTRAKLRSQARISAMSDPDQELPKLIDVPPTAAALQQPTQVRVGGGRPGLSAQHFEGGTTHKRVSALDGRPDALAEHRQVPIAVLHEVRDLLDGGRSEATPNRPLSAHIRDLLAPWLE
jgi:hypothetical protein